MTPEFERTWRDHANRFKKRGGVGEWALAVRTFAGALDAERERNAKLERAVAAAHDYIGTGDATEDYERLAERFYAATRFIAPGKAQPAAMGGTRHELRFAKFQEWLEADATRIRAAIAAALDTT
jgi:hypothetical protein